MSAITLESVKVNEVTSVEDYWSEPEETIEVSLYEPDVIIAQNEAYEAEKEIDVILERPEESQNESKEDQPLVLVKPPTLPCLLVKFKKWMVIKERSQIFYTADTFVPDDQDEQESFVLEVSNELLILKEGVQAALPKCVDASRYGVILPVFDSGVDLLLTLSTLPFVCSVVLSLTLSTSMSVSRSVDLAPLVVSSTQLH
ncbi:hypothetical protein Sjap_014962 [Stephania japonica]|uniref:Uncharacterized protein n=1 Tax=Stephania japonica TaxID=461633 RepID=A0AAP0IIP7_9MAGN